MNVSWAVHTITIGALALGACHKGSSTPSNVDPAYRRDITHICDAERLSGADQQPDGARQIAIAQWLGPNIQTEKARDFLAELVSLDGAAKGARMRQEASAVGLDGCAAAEAWK